MRLINGDMLPSLHLCPIGTKADDSSRTVARLENKKSDSQLLDLLDADLKGLIAESVVADDPCKLLAYLRETNHDALLGEDEVLHAVENKMREDLWLDRALETREKTLSGLSAICSDLMKINAFFEAIEMNIRDAGPGRISVKQLEKILKSDVNDIVNDKDVNDIVDYTIPRMPDRHQRSYEDFEKFLKEQTGIKDIQEVMDYVILTFGYKVLIGGFFDWVPMKTHFKAFTNEDRVIRVLRRAPHAVAYLGESFVENRTVVMAAVETDGYALGRTKFKKDIDFVRAALSSNPAAIRFVDYPTGPSESWDTAVLDAWREGISRILKELEMGYSKASGQSPPPPTPTHPSHYASLSHGFPCSGFISTNVLSTETSPSPPVAPRILSVP